MRCPRSLGPMLALAAALWTFPDGAPAHGDVLDPTSPPDPMLETVADGLSAIGVDVLHDHDSDRGLVAPSFGDPPRMAPLLGFQAWPTVEVDLEQHGAWLADFESGARGALAAVASDEPRADVAWDELRTLWLGAPRADRVIVTFDAADLEVAERVAAVLVAAGHAVHLAIAAPEREPLDPEQLGRLFASAGHHLVLDTASARLNPIIQFEAELLAELRRQDAWIAADDGGLPPVKRGSMDVIESLGALPMQVLPGGIALGRRAVLEGGIAGAALAISGSDFALELDGERLVLEQVSESTAEALRGFIAIADSHSVVDIAGGSVTLAAPLEGTRVGRRMEQADRMPFHHLSVSGARKSVIVDEAIRVRRDGDDIAADVTLEVRFYRTTDDGFADRIAALRFTVQDVTGRARLLDLAWTRAPDRKIGFDGSGIEALVDDLEPLALDAALIAVLRAVG